jgi:hypothetical protein
MTEVPRELMALQPFRDIPKFAGRSAVSYLPQRGLTIA